jgi:hypothetical protein
MPSASHPRSSKGVECKQGATRFLKKSLDLYQSLICLSAHLPWYNKIDWFDNIYLIEFKHSYDWSANYGLVAEYDPIWSARYGKYVHEIPKIPKYANADTLF